MNKILIFCAVLTVASCAIATPKKYDPEGGFLPSSARYYNPSNAKPKINETDNQMTNSDHVQAIIKEDPNRIQRFGLSGYGNVGVGGYPQTGTGIAGYSPVKIDLGGVVLGTLIGLGAILIIPKLAHVFTSGYRRSVENELETVTDMLSRFDKTLEQHNIDSSTCMQRVICTYVQDAQKNVMAGQASTIDGIVQTISGNSMLSFFLDGTAVQEAIKMGKSSDSDSCTALYAKCPVSRDNIMQVISSFLPA